MSDIFFRQLEMPKPHAYLGVGSGNHGEQTARIIIEFEKLLQQQPANLVVVVGDVNSTVACSLVAVKLGIPVAHVEAGLRSFDRRMPEEINRMVTDRISDWLFVTEQSGLDNLKAEGVPDDQVFFVGNLMIDSLVSLLEKARRTQACKELGLENGRYCLVTIHRPSNVDSRESLAGVADLLESVSAETLSNWREVSQRMTLPPDEGPETNVAEASVVFPVHPRTAGRLREFGLEERIRRIPGIRLLEPLGYLEFLNLMENAGLVLTDSGGIQEETTFLGVPCLTLRENTERPATITSGTNELVQLDAASVAERVRAVFNGGASSGTVPHLWDGRASERVVEVLENVL
jgi:UDP-N-acetylglucosamine 2-epimerase (non-hydrolysing)